MEEEEEEADGEDGEDRDAWQCSVSEEPYGLVECDCRKSIPGKTGVILGPLW